MSHLPRSRARYGGRGNVLCSHLVCLMADEWAEMGNESHTKVKKLRLAVDGAAKHLNERAEVKASVSGERLLQSPSPLHRGRERLSLPPLKENTDIPHIQVFLNASFTRIISLGQPGFLFL